MLHRQHHREEKPWLSPVWVCGSLKAALSVQLLEKIQGLQIASMPMTTQQTLKLLVLSVCQLPPVQHMIHDIDSNIPA
jgi:hypothetical protein